MAAVRFLVVPVAKKVSRARLTPDPPRNACTSRAPRAHQLDPPQTSPDISPVRRPLAQFTEITF